MRKITLFLFFAVALLLTANISNAQNVATNSGSGLNPTYPDLATAITALNGATITSPVVITLTGNETAPNQTAGPIASGYYITATGTVTNTITIQGSSSTITAGTNTNTAGGAFDAVFKIVGGDYITIKDFTIQENAGNVVTTVGATNTMTESAFLLIHASATDGAQNNTIQNNIITLNSVYANSVGILSTSASTTSTAGVNTTGDATSTAGTNSNNKFYNNTISNVATGMYFICPPVTATVTETGNDIGGSSAGTANTITFGNATAMSGVWNRSTSTAQFGIGFRNGAGNSVRFNSVTSNSAAYVGSAGLNGIMVSPGTTPTGVTYTTTMSDNTVNLTTSGVALVTGIDFGFGLSTGTIVGSSNNITITQTSSAANSAAVIGLKANYASASNTCSSNTIVFNQSQSSGALSTPTTGMTLAGTSASTITANSNNITINQTGSGTGTITGALICISVAGTSTTNTVQNNTIVVNQTTSVASGITNNLTGVVATSAASTGLVIGSAGNPNAITFKQGFTGAGTYTSGATTFLSVNAAHGSVSIVNNTFNTTGSTIRSTGACDCILGGATTIVALNTIKSNTVNIDRVSTSGAVGFYTQASVSPNDPADSISLNNITYTNLAGTSSATIIRKDGGLSSANRNICNNTINVSGTNTGTVIGISYAYSTNTNCISNSVTISSAGATVTGITATANNTASVVSYNTLSLTSSVTSATSMVGIALLGTGAHSVTQNTFSAMNFSGSLTTGGTMTAISMGAGTGANVFSNTITNLSSGSAGAGSPIVDGILVSGGASINVYKNKIYGLTTACTGATTIVSGIRISGGGTTGHNYYNNLIGALTATATTNADAIRGINITSATSLTTHNIYYNSIYLNASSSGGTFGCTGIFHTTSVTATTAALNLRNNNIVNVSTAAGAGLCVGYRRSSTTLTNYSATSNNNNFFGTSGLFADGTNTYTTLATFKAGMSTRDGSSVNESPTYQSTTGSSADFLKYSIGVATQLEAGAAPVGGITDDYITTTRNVTTPDIGAWELAGIPLDLTGPSISYTSLTNAAVATSRVLTGFATITDISGVSGGASVPRIYYKKSTDADAFVGNTSGDNGWKYVSASNGTSPYDFTIDYTIINGGSIVASDVIQYFVVAQDVNNNLSSLPVGATASGNPPVQNINAKATTPNTYTILASFSGNYNVGAGQTYTTIAAAITALNSGIVTGATTFSFQDASYSETYPLTINAVTGASVTNTVTFKPTQTGTTVTGASASGGIILSGANYVTFDGSTSGGTDKNLTIANTNTSGAVMTFQNGASNNTLKNCKFNGVSTSTSNGVLFFSTTTGSGNSSNTIQNNDIGKGATSPAYGIYNNGSATKNSANTFTGNRIFDFSNTAIFDNANSIKFVYTGNEIFQNTNQSTSLVGYRPSATTIEGFTFTRNYIHDMKTTGTGNIYGIHLFDISTGANDSGVVTNNVISISETTPLTVYGIYDQSATSEKYMVYYNSVYLGGSVTGASNSRAYNWSIASTSKVRNNIFVNARSGGSGKHYAIAYNTTYANITSDYNCIYNAGGTGNVFGYDGTIDRATIAAFRTATGKETNSVNGNPQFASTTTLVPVSSGTGVVYGMNMGNGSTTATSVDFNGASRSSTNPDMGAYEFTASIDLTGLGNTTLPAGTYSGLTWTGNTCTFSGDVTIDGTLNLTNGIIDMGANTLTIGTSAGNTGNLTRSGGSIKGIVKRWFGTSTTTNSVFPLDYGDGANYVGASISFTSAPSTGGTLTAQYFTSGAGNFASNGGAGFINVGGLWPGVNFINVASQYWRITAGDGLAGYTYDITLIGNNMNVSSTGYLYTGIIKRPDNTQPWGWNQSNHVNTTSPSAIPTLGGTGFTTFSDFGIGGNVDNLLPVELSSFTANVDKRNVKLNWTTSSEQNNVGYDIERKPESSQQWSKINFVEGHGTSNIPHSYSYEDRNLLTGKYNYRLKQMDVNGNFEYLALENVIEVGIPSKFDMSQNYPNPFNPTTKINYDLPFDSKVSIRLFDMTGREVAVIVNATQTAGYYTAQFNGANLSSGTYFYNIIAEGGNNNKFVTTKKMVLVK